MTNTKPGKKSWLKRILLAGLVLVLIGAGIYWYVATEKFTATKERKAAYTLNVAEFIKEFRVNDSAANAKYRDKIIEVHGTVTELESPDTATVNVKFIDPETGDYAIFAFQEQYLHEAKSIKVGDTVSIKGSCSGSTYVEILDAYSVQFKRSTLNK